jgi:hypothetical protein
MSRLRAAASVRRTPETRLAVITVAVFAAAVLAEPPANDPMRDDPMQETRPQEAQAARQKPASPAAKNPDAPLAGPQLAEKENRPTLIEFGIDGKVRRPETTPEEAALRLLDLDDTTRAAVDRVIAARARILEHFVARNINLLIIAGTAGATGDKLDQFLVGLASFRKLLPLWDRGPIRAEIEAVLPEAQRAQFGALLEEYWTAIVDEHRRAKPGEDITWFGAMLEERMAIVGKQIEQAYQRQEKSGTLAYYYLMDGLDLKPAQERRVRELITEFTERGGDDLPKAEQEKLFGGILAMLTPEQAAKLLKKVQGDK